jgi:hypothetical protein
MSETRTTTGSPSSGFRLGVYVFKDAEIVDFTAPYGVFSVARRFDPDLDVQLTSVCTGSSVYGRMGLLDGLAATNRKEPDGWRRPGGGRPRSIAWQRVLPPAGSAARASSIADGSITAGGIGSDMEIGFHLLRRAGYGEHLLAGIAPVMEYRGAYEVYREHVEMASGGAARIAGAVV